MRISRVCWLLFLVWMIFAGGIVSITLAHPPLSEQSLAVCGGLVASVFVGFVFCFVVERLD